MVQLREKRILIDGQPTIILSGEIHYFRLAKTDWQDRLNKLKDLGCNTVASYIPWIVHNEVEGEFDLGEVGEFIDLCAKNDLWFIARPGPFVMAEMKNEGIPYWVYEKHPDAIPVGWNGESARSKTLDLLNEGYLNEVDRWYGAVVPILASRLQPKGGNVIAIQLDNEVGMLSWVNNQPDLTETVLCDFSAWLATHYSADELKKRYPVDIFDPSPRLQAFRTPKDDYALAFLNDFGDYNRTRIARYIDHLRKTAERLGVSGVPFVVNIHGCGGGRGTGFPMGLHHLYQAFTQSDGYLPGTDHYLGNISRENVGDMAFVNAFTHAVARPDQPISGMEFEVGSCDYGETGGLRLPGSAADLKVRMSLVQGNRALNYYLLAGGVNPVLKHPKPDGNGRIATTGQRHGFAAPISPEGDLDPTYNSLKDTTQAMRAIADKLADMDEQHDDLSLGLIVDYYKTDFRYGDKMMSLVQALELPRGWLGDITRTLIDLGYRFGAVDLQHRPIQTKTVVVASSSAMPVAVQAKLADHVRQGGNLFLVGDLPSHDMEAQPCTVLADALGLRPGAVRYSDNMFLSVRGIGIASFEPEVRIWRGQAVEGGEPFLRFAYREEHCGTIAKAGSGQAVLITCNYPSHPPLYRRIAQQIGLVAGLSHDYRYGGVVMQSVKGKTGERFLSLLNLDQEVKALALHENGQPLFEGQRVVLQAHQAKMLPLGVRFGSAVIHSSTVEVIRYSHGVLEFRPSEADETVLAHLPVSARVLGGKASRHGEVTQISVARHSGSLRISGI